MRWILLLAVAIVVLSCGSEGPRDSYPSYTAPFFPSDTHDSIGLPACPGTLISREFFITCHDDDWLIPRWVAYVLSPQDLEGAAERTENFRADPNLPFGDRAELKDYDEPIFDRGHMAPAGDFKRSHDAMSDTFYLSNMAPQYPGLNRGPWRGLESAIRNLVHESKATWVYTGNLNLDIHLNPVDPEYRIGENGVAVPSHCFKAILSQSFDDSVEVFGYILPNVLAPGPWEEYLSSADEVERLSGLDFFSRLPDNIEEAIESLSIGIE